MTVDAVDWFVWTFSTSIAQGWYDGSKNEEGLVFIHIGGDNQFNSSENGSNLDPVFVFTYDLAGGKKVMVTK